MAPWLGVWEDDRTLCRARRPGLTRAGALPALSSSQAPLSSSAAWGRGPGYGPCSRGWASQAQPLATRRGRQRLSRWSGAPASEPAAARAAASLSGSQAEAEPSSGDGGGPGGSWDDARTAAARLLKGLMFATFALSAVKILPTLGVLLAQRSLFFHFYYPALPAGERDKLC